MYIDIITADQTLFSGEADAVTLPGSKGQFQVLNNHAALISSLDKGKVILKTKEGKQSFEVNGGIVEILNNKIVVLA
jgi:F-type H+-transporting ATPase subunit epsilon